MSFDPNPTLLDRAFNKSQSASPWSWDKLRGMWVPALGKTGLTLFDVSGWKNHGTLTNMDSDNWVVDGEIGRALEFVSSQSHSADFANPITSYPFSMVWHGRLTSIVDQAMLSIADPAHAQKYAALFAVTSRGWEYQMRNDGDTFDTPGFSVASGGSLDTDWHTVVTVSRSSTVHEIWLDGNLLDTDTNATTFPTTMTEGAIGKRTGAASPAYSDSLNSSSLMYARAFLPSEIRQLARDPPAPLRLRDTRIPIVGAAGGSETATLVATIAVVTQPSVTATYQSALSATLAQAVATVEQPAVTAQHTAEFTATLAEAVATVAQPAVAAQGVSEWAATLAVATATVAQPAVTGAYQSVLSASLAEVVAQVAQPAVTSTHQAVYSAALAETIAVVTQPAVTATSGAEQVASLVTTVAVVTQPSVVAQYASVQTATLAVAAAVVEQPTVTATSGAEQVATLTVVAVTIEQPSVSATYQAVLSAAFVAAVAAVEQPSVTGAYQAVLSASVSVAVAAVTMPSVTATIPGAGGSAVIYQQQFMLSS